MSLALGSSVEASCCVARKILRSPLRASSSARTLDSRPTTKGVIMYGKITMSRMGIMGSLRGSDLSRGVVITKFNSAFAATPRTHGGDSIGWIVLSIVWEPVDFVQKEKRRLLYAGNRRL